MLSKWQGSSIGGKRGTELYRARESEKRARETVRVEQERKRVYVESKRVDLSQILKCSQSAKGKGAGEIQVRESDRELLE